MLLDIAGLPLDKSFFVLNSMLIALWSKSEFCSAGKISQEVEATKRGMLMRKKSILDLFNWFAFLGQKV